MAVIAIVCILFFLVGLILFLEEHTRKNNWKYEPPWRYVKTEIVTELSEKYCGEACIVFIRNRDNRELRYVVQYSSLDELKETVKHFKNRHLIEI